LSGSGSVKKGCRLIIGEDESINFLEHVFAILAPGTQISLLVEPSKITKLLAPIVPSTILCIGLNYKHHAAEAE